MKVLVKSILALFGIAVGASGVNALGAAASCKYCVQVRQYCSFIKSDDQFTSGAKAECQSLPDTALLTVHGFPENQEDWPRCSGEEENMMFAALMDDDDSGCAWCNGPNSTCHSLLDEGPCHQSCGGAEEFLVLAAQLDSVVARGNLSAMATFVEAAAFTNFDRKTGRIAIASECDPDAVRHAVILERNVSRSLDLELRRRKTQRVGYLPGLHVGVLP
jgi:hypothetical protein